MSIGLVCHYVKEKTNKKGVTELVNLFNNKTLQLNRWQKGQYSEEVIRETYVHNVDKLIEVMQLVINDGIKLFRLSSDLLPLSDKVPREWWDNDTLKSKYKIYGDLCRKNNIRVTFHPGQFCVLNSDRDSVIENAISDLKMHAWIFDACEFDESPYYAINIHAAKRDAFNKLIQNIKTLPGNIKNRLTLENCETVANVKDLFNVYEMTGVPIVFDSHHHIFNTGDLTMREAFDLSCKTWSNNIKPLQHLANTEPGFEKSSFTDRRRHSNFIHYIPDEQISKLITNEIDVEVESKTKNLAIKDMLLKFPELKM
jgi:UV DNA damage endonuclease